MEPRIDWATRRAQKVLAELGVSSFDNLRDIEGVCAGRGVFVSNQKLLSLDGFLLRERRMIGVRASIPGVGRRRFTIAHELGHWEMHCHLSHAQLCTAADLAGYSGSAEELEANAFAAELLMPTQWVSEVLRRASPSVGLTRRLAEKYQTSLTSAAIKMADCMDIPVVVVFSSQGRMGWHRRSRKAEGLRLIQPGATLSGDSLARYATEEVEDAPGLEEVSAHAWFPDEKRVNRLSVLEESVVLGDSGVTLTVLLVEEQ